MPLLHVAADCYWFISDGWGMETFDRGVETVTVAVEDRPLQLITPKHTFFTSTV